MWQYAVDEPGLWWAVAENGDLEVIEVEPDLETCWHVGSEESYKVGELPGLFQRARPYGEVPPPGGQLVPAK